MNFIEFNNFMNGFSYNEAFYNECVKVYLKDNDMLTWHTGIDCDSPHGLSVFTWVYGMSWKCERCGIVENVGISRGYIPGSPEQILAARKMWIRNNKYRNSVTSNVVPIGQSDLKFF